MKKSKELSWKTCAPGKPISGDIVRVGHLSPSNSSLRSYLRIRQSSSLTSRQPLAGEMIAMPISLNRRERSGLFASMEQFGAIDGVNVGAGARFNDIGACAFACNQFAVAEINLQGHFAQ
jgi:hypothetical protein